MNRIVFTLLMLLGVGYFATTQAQSEKEKTIFDKNGEARGYLAEDNNIYLFTGEAVAYLTNSRQTNFKNVFGMNGDHLGWYTDGIFFNHQQKVVGFFEDAPNVTAQASLLIPDKYPKQPVFRRMAKPAPLKILTKPFGIFKWSSLEAFLRSGMR
ncbi:hypothetical protein BKI52_21925 [marine bacterium AO1-C]|nr:hypothetical protein BKI52_21925 [marine bacterium AO1-C]